MHLPSKRQQITIGIFGSNGKTSTANMLSCIFNSAGLATEIISDEKNVSNKRIMTNIEIHKRLKSIRNNDIIIIEITEGFLKNESLSNICFDILIHCQISEGSYEKTPDGISKINSLLNQYKGTKALVINTDDDNWKDILIDLENTYLITYGLGNKATVTASSIECSKLIKFCYCIQRSLTDFNSNIIEPMEVPVEVKALGQYNVYNGLAAITSALICGIDLNIILYSLNKSSMQQSGVNILFEDGYSVIDNVCDTILSYETGFEVVQNLSYKNVFLVFDINTKEAEDICDKIINLISTWSLILNIKMIYFFYSGAEMEFYYYNKLKNSLKENTLKTVRLGATMESIEYIVGQLNEEDLLLFFCSSNLNFLREKIAEVIDRHILGELSDHRA